MKNAIVWSKYQCPQCDQAKLLLKLNGYIIEERKIGDGYAKEELLAAVPSARSVPQIFLEDAYVGGLLELRTYLQNSTGETVNG
jgi:glutaredoxin 3